MKRKVQLEKEAEAVSNASMQCPRIYQMPPAEGREALEKAQDEPVEMCPAKIGKQMVQTRSRGRIPVYIVEPEHVENPVNVIYYIHGAGWVFGSFHTHEKLVRELASRTGSIVVFPEYDRAPEAKFPVAIEQCFAVLCMIPQLLEQKGFFVRQDTLTVAGDSVGGNMAIAMALRAKYEMGPYIQKLLLYYPVTDACFETGSYCEFAKDYYLYRDGMKWFWEQYTSSCRDRENILASPLKADTACLRGFPQTMILNGEADVLRDEGEAFARRLRAAGVPVTAVRFQGIIHDFVMLHSLNNTNACRAAMDLSTEWICRQNTGIVCG